MLKQKPNVNAKRQYFYHIILCITICFEIRLVLIENLSQFMNGRTDGQSDRQTTELKAICLPMYGGTCLK